MECKVVAVSPGSDLPLELQEVHALAGSGGGVIDQVLVAVDSLHQPGDATRVGSQHGAGRGDASEQVGGQLLEVDGDRFMVGGRAARFDQAKPVAGRPAPRRVLHVVEDLVSVVRSGSCLSAHARSVRRRDAEGQVRVGTHVSFARHWARSGAVT